MRKSTFSLMIVACLSAGLLWAADPVPSTELPAGFASKDLKDQQDERTLLVKTTNIALTKGDFSKMLKYLSTADYKRMEEITKRDNPTLDGRIDQIQKAWEAKYGKKFSFTDDKLLESALVIREGEVADPVLAKMNWPVQVTGKMMRDAMNEKTLESSGEYLSKGRNVAVVTFPEGHGLPQMHLSLLHESIDDWRIDISDAITGEQIYQNLLNRLTAIGENVSTWPPDVNEAYRLVAHNVLAAIENVQPASNAMQRTAADAQ